MIANQTNEMQEMTRDFKDEIELGINDLEKKISDLSQSAPEGRPEQGGVGHEVLSLVQGVGRAIFSYP